MTQPSNFSYPPRGLPRDEAARYIGITPQAFDRMVEGGIMPRPKQIDGHLIWDRMAIDSAFSLLPFLGELASTLSAPPDPEVYTPKSLAEFWGCSERHVRNLCDNGYLPSFRIGRKLVRIRREEAEKYANSSME